MLVLLYAVFFGTQFHLWLMPMAAQTRQEQLLVTAELYGLQSTSTNFLDLQINC